MAGMKYSEAKGLLKEHGQEHVLRFWSKLGKGAKADLLRQISGLDFVEVGRMQAMLAEREQVSGRVPKPAPVRKLSRKGEQEAVAAGEAELRKGRVAALLVAGGQGSRLGYDGPKGAYCIGPISGKPLFYFHARKLVRLRRIYGKPVPFYIMTSEANDSATRACFAEYDFFGLDPADVFFFKQGLWPALDEEGKLMLEEPGRIAVSPDGHGGTLSALVESGALADMEARKIRSVFFFQVDNPLVEICDPAFIGVHVAERAEFSLKLCLKSAPTERMGAVGVESSGRCKLIEYSELTPAQAARFKYGSPAIHVFSRTFLKRVSSQAMPLHLAHKQINYVDDKGRVVRSKAPNGYKFEKFIFDILPEARRVVNLAFERSEEFSPVKNATGCDSAESCQSDMQIKWRRRLQEAGIVVPEGVAVEIDPAYAALAGELREKGLHLEAE